LWGGAFKPQEMPNQLLNGETNDFLITVMDVRNRVLLVKCKAVRMCEVA
jgi:hypothetical protein